MFLFYSAAPQRTATAKCYTGWQPIQGLAVHCRLGTLLVLNPGLRFHNLVSAPCIFCFVLLPIIFCFASFLFQFFHFAERRNKINVFSLYFASNNFTFFLFQFFQKMFFHFFLLHFLLHYEAK